MSELSEELAKCQAMVRKAGEKQQDLDDQLVKDNIREQNFNFDFRVSPILIRTLMKASTEELSMASCSGSSNARKSFRRQWRQALEGSY